MKRSRLKTLIRLFLLFTFTFCVSIVYAQEKKVSGKVIDGSTSEALPGVNIVVKGTSTGTISDIEGNYTISVPEESNILRFSYVGYLSQEIEINDQTTIDVSLSVDMAQLEEVVVVGYGTMKKSDLTGAVSSVSEEDIVSAKSSNAAEILQGKIAGIDMTRSNGQAGSGYNILIRGQRSFSASNDPIYIVDGIDYGENVNINPNDIASIEVLKDASSTAIYGSRGANGVILITTKKGEAGKPTISFNTYYGITSPLGKLPMGDADYYLRMTRDLVRTNNPDLWDVPDDEIDVIPALFPSEIDGYNDGTDFDWIDAQMEDFGTQQDYHLSITGGNEKNTYAVSLNHFIEDNFIPNDFYKRYSIKSNVESKVTKFLEMGNSTFIAYKDQNKGEGINYNMIPLVEAFDSTGKLIPEPDERVPFENPLIDQDPDNRLREIYKTDIFSTFYGKLNLMPGLSFKSSFNVDLEFEREGEFTGEYEGIDRVNSAILKNKNEYKWTWTNILTFDKTAGNHHLMVNAGTETMSKRTERIYMSGREMELKHSWWYGLRTGNPADLTITDPDSKPSDRRYPLQIENLQSFIGRIHYGFQEKYLLTLTGRYDGASQLREKWDFFPSVAVGWRISEESFVKDISAISNLKLRVGYGTSGNQSVKPYSSLGSISSYIMYYEFGFSEEAAIGYRTASLNTSSRWEKTTALNIGLDFGLIENRVSGTIEIYQATTKDILQQVTLPPTSAVTTVVENIGETETQGIEVSLRTVNISTSDFTWTTDITFATTQEEITYLAGGVKQDVANGWFVGEPLRVAYDWDKIGIWQSDEEEEAALYQSEPGDIKFRDVDGNDTINDADRVVLGAFKPKWSGGLTSTMTYKNFDLTIFVYARMGQMIRDNVQGMWAPDGRENSIERDYWTPNNATNDWPKVDPNRTRSGWSQATSLQYTDGSFIKIKDITLGYTLPESLTSKVLISSARIYITAKNAFAFGEYFKQGRYDPEAVNNDPEASFDKRGVSNVSFPIPKMFAIGANINF